MEFGRDASDRAAQVNVNRHLQGGFNPLKYVPICLTFSAQTSANQVQDLLDAKCEKRRKGIFGPSAGKKYILFVDDVNMPLKVLTQCP